MIFIFILFGFVLFIINKKTWENNVKILLLLFPFFGYIAGNLEPYSNTRITSIFYDFVLIIPIYLSVITMKRNHGYFGMMSINLQFAFFIFTFLILIQFFNPFNNLSLIGKLVGLKVWLFYFLLVPVGFYYIKGKDEILKICKTMSNIAFIPCIVAIVQFTLAHTIGHEETMNLFYSPEIARASTQGFGKFDIAPGIQLIRIPSTFSYPAQFSNYLLFSFVPALTAINFSKNKKEKNLYSILIFLIILASIASGIRGMYIYIPVFFIYYWFFSSDIKKVFKYTLLIFILILIIFITEFANLDLLLSDVKRQFMNYRSSAFKDVSSYLLNNLLGNGLGASTPQTINVTGVSGQIGPNLNESYFFKVIGELGFFGLIALFIFYLSILNFFTKCLKSENEKIFKTFISSFIAFYLTMITINFKSVHIDLFPTNMLIYFFLGVILKLNQINNEQRS